jgi:hypothetical protein
MAPLSKEILLPSKELRGMSMGNSDVQLLTTVPGVCYYIALLVNRMQYYNPFHAKAWKFLRGSAGLRSRGRARDWRGLVV